jgi:hypothetical protein
LTTKKSNRVRQAVKPGITKSLWKAVKIAKDVNASSIPNQMYNIYNELVKMENLS